MKNPFSLWARKQRAAKPGRFYGDGGTIHDTTFVDVETHQGEVVAVWFRCQMLPFKQTDVKINRAIEMRTSNVHSQLHGVHITDDSP